MQNSIVKSLKGQNIKFVKQVLFSFWDLFVFKSFCQRHIKCSMKHFMISCSAVQTFLGKNYMYKAFNFSYKISVTTTPFWVNLHHIIWNVREMSIQLQSHYILVYLYDSLFLKPLDSYSFSLTAPYLRIYSISLCFSLGLCNCNKLTRSNMLFPNFVWQ